MEQAAELSSTSPVESVGGGPQLDGRTVFGVELRVPATMTLDRRVLLRLDEDRAADVALVVPDHQIAFQLPATANSSRNSVVADDRTGVGGVP